MDEGLGIGKMIWEFWEAIFEFWETNSLFQEATLVFW
jgi:hypothetical protein